MNQEKKAIIEKLDFYFDKRIRVHIKLLSGKFRNGLIIEKESENVYVMREDVLGLIHIFVSEVNYVEEYKTREETNG